MAEKSIIIIGAGIAGLCAGIYARMNGYQTRIFEMHTIPGGLATAWKRGGYTIDSSVHWLVGSGPGIHLNRYWNEVGLLEGRQFINHDCYMVYQGKDGRVFNLFCDPDRLEKHMLELAPQDAPAIREFVAGLRFGISFNPPEKERYELGPLGGVKTVLDMLPKLSGLQKWMNITMEQLAERFQDPLIRGAIHDMWQPEFSALFMFATLGFLYKKQAGYPLGGSLPLACYLEKRYLELNGQVQYRARVDRILVEDSPHAKGDRAVGVRLADGTEHRADVVISAADGYTTIYKLLEGKYTTPSIEQQYRDWKTFPPLVYTGLGVNRTFPEVTPSVSGYIIELKEPVILAGKERRSIGVRVHNCDPHFAPPGKTTLVVSFDSDYEYWKALAADQRAYEAEKEKIAQTLTGILDQQWPGLAAQVEMRDVATPLTFERYTGNWKGSFEGWLLTPKQGAVTLPKTLSGLENFWMAGQWVYPGGGLPSGVATGREVIWRQCEKDGKKFER